MSAVERSTLFSASVPYSIFARFRFRISIRIRIISVPAGMSFSILSRSARSFIRLVTESRVCGAP